VRSEAAFNLIPVDDISQFHKRVLGIEHLAKALTEQLRGLCNRCFSAHKTSPIFARNWRYYLRTLQLMTP
jgi:hypothetical protein